MFFNDLSSLSNSMNETDGQKEFQAFKNQLKVVQDLIDVCKNKIINKELCSDDLDNMKKEMKHMTELEQLVTSEKMKPCYVPYKIMALKAVEESYHICNWLLEKRCNEMDNAFDINTFINKIFEACADKEDPLDHIHTIFKGAFKNSDYFNLSFFGNLKLEETDENVSIKLKKDYIRSQKRPLEEQVVPDEVENETGNNELQITLIRVMKSLKKAVKKNNGNPVEFYKFVVDPFSLACTVENLFHVSSLFKDGNVKIELDNETNSFSTITVVNKNMNNDTNDIDNSISTLVTMNNDIWKFYIEKYNITERMIEQGE